MIAVALYNLVSGSSICVQGKIEVFVTEPEVESIREVGRTVTQVHLIVIINYTVMVLVYVYDITRLDISLQDAVPCCTPIFNLLFVLEDSCRLISPEITYRMTVRSAIKFWSIVIKHIHIAMNDTVLSRYISHLILIIRTVDTYIILEITSDLVVPSQS